MARRYSLVGAFVHLSGGGWWNWETLRWLEDRRIYWQALVSRPTAAGWSCHRFPPTPTPQHPPELFTALGIVLLVILFIVCP